jgi:hypothetical protein
MRRIALALLLPLASARAQDPAVLQARVEKECAAISETLEAYLGPKFKAPVAVELKTKEAIGEFSRELAKTQVPKGLLEVAQKLAERLRQVPRGYDILEHEIKMVEANVAGLYDPDTDRFFVVEGTGSPGSPMFVVTAAHELVHAYRDVDKDFWARTLKLIHTNPDEAQAIRFLVEGDATLLGNAIGVATLQKRDPAPFVELGARNRAGADAMIEATLAEPRLAEFPRALKETLVAAYIEGMLFAAAIFRDGGKEALERAYDRPPRSTEQVLHPEKYLGAAPDEPVVFEGGDPLPALGEGWALLLRAVVGEFDLRVLFTEALGRDRARTAAAGWDGAVSWFCERDGSPSFLGLVTTWDEATDAEEFARAWADWAAARDGKKGGVGGEGEELRVETEDGLVVVRRNGNDVLVADGVPPDRVDAVFAAMAEVKRSGSAPGWTWLLFGGSLLFLLVLATRRQARAAAAASRDAPHEVHAPA